MSLLRAAGRLAALGGLLGVSLARRRRNRGRVVPWAPPDRGAELVVICLLWLAALASAAFVAVYALDRLGHSTQLLGLALGLAFALLAAASALTGHRLVVTEELEEEYPQPGVHSEDEQQVAQVVRESGDRLTRRRLLLLSAGAAGSALAAALVVPVASLGPVLRSGALRASPWRAGRRLVGEDGRPIRADAVPDDTFLTAYPEGADRERMGAPVVVVRLAPAALELPPGRAGWAPEGILAYSKVCTHAGCAIALYRAPLFRPTSARPAFVCPCHYSTFDPATGGTVLFGPAGRPLPQLPLRVDADGNLRAAGDLSDGPGPSWWGVRGNDRA